MKGIGRGIDRRITELEKKAGVGVRRVVVMLKNYANKHYDAYKNCDINTLKDWSRCPEYKEFLQDPESYEGFVRSGSTGGCVVFRPPCGDCKGTEKNE